MTHIHTGLAVRGSSGMVVDRPQGSGDYVFVHFLEPVSLQPGGPLFSKPNMCILYSPHGTVAAEWANRVKRGPRQESECQVAAVQAKPTGPTRTMRS
jgi:uncharacterized protein (AIM24 family)